MKMKSKLITILLFLSLSHSFSYEINGVKSTVYGIKIIKVWGTHQERGFAYGYLLSEEIQDILTNYLIKEVLYGDLQSYEGFRFNFLQNFDVDEKYQIEAQAIVDGIYAQGNYTEFTQFLGKCHRGICLSWLFEYWLLG